MWRVGNSVAARLIMSPDWRNSCRLQTASRPRIRSNCSNVSFGVFRLVCRGGVMWSRIRSVNRGAAPAASMPTGTSPLLDAASPRCSRRDIREREFERSLVSAVLSGEAGLRCVSSTHVGDAMVHRREAGGRRRRRGGCVPSYRRLARSRRLRPTEGFRRARAALDLSFVGRP